MVVGNIGWVGVGATRSFGADVAVDVAVAFGAVVGVLGSKEGMRAPPVAKLVLLDEFGTVNAKSELWESPSDAIPNSKPVRCATTGLEPPFTGAVSLADNRVPSEGNSAVAKLLPATLSGPDSPSGSRRCARAPGRSWREYGAWLFPISYRTSDPPPIAVSPICWGELGMEVSQPAIHPENPRSDVIFLLGSK